MEKNRKKISKLERDSLKFMIEDFLGKDRKKLKKKLETSPEKGKDFWNKIEKIISPGFRGPWELDEEDKQGVDYIKLAIKLHQLLEPVFLSLQQALLDFKFKTLPGRISSRELTSDIESDKIDKKEPWYEYRRLANQYSPVQEEEFHNIVFDTKVMQHISFESGNITFHNNPTQQLLNFLDLFRGVPISYFSRCAYEKCGKLIVVTRKNKKYCTGTNCAARKFQTNKWNDNKEGMKAAERKRYHSRRKK